MFMIVLDEIIPSLFYLLLFAQRVLIDGLFEHHTNTFFTTCWHALRSLVSFSLSSLLINNSNCDSETSYKRLRKQALHLFSYYNHRQQTLIDGELVPSAIKYIE